MMATPNGFPSWYGGYIWIVVARALLLNMGPQRLSLNDVTTRSYEH